MATNKLKQITTKAKQLYKAGKYKKWTDAIKAASKQLRAVKIIQPGEKKTAKSKKVLQQVRNKKTGVFKGYKVVGAVNMYSIRDMYEKDIKNVLQQIENLKANKVKATDPVVKRLKKNLQSLKKQLRQQNVLINQNLR